MFGPPPLVKVALCPLSAHDAPWLAALHEREFFSPWSQQGFVEILSLSTSVGWSTPPETPGFILLQISDGHAEILTFMIAETARHMGLGNLLLTHAIATARQASAQSMLLEVAQSREAAQGLYRKHGFRISSRRKSYYKTRTSREDALLMTLDLDTSQPQETA